MKIVNEKTPRIGVFVCHCGINIGGIIDIQEVVEHAKSLPNVVYAEENLYTCSSEGLTKIKEAIQKYDLNRVVVASCTPRTHEPLFRVTCEEAGLNKYLFQMANIREHCSWVHAHERDKATEKAKDIVRIAVAKARLLEAQEEREIEVEPSVLVIGGGIAGMTAALCSANRGFKAFIVEKEQELGGMLRQLHKLYPTGEEADKALKNIINSVKAHRNVQVFTSAAVKDVKGFIGNYNVSIEVKEKGNVNIKAGTIIVASGADYFEPIGMYGYKEYENVITQLQLEHLLKSRELKKPKKVVMIQCVGAREDKGRTYCSRICCTAALKNSMLIKEAYPDTDVYILFRDLQTYGKEYEELRWKAREKGIKLVQYIPERPPNVNPEAEGKLTVSVYHTLLGEEVKIGCDLVVLSTPLIQREDGKELSRILKVPLGPDDFFFEAHVKLRPVDFATDGIYVCGTAQGPKDIAESIAQAYAAASRAAIPMASKKVRTEAITAVVDSARCAECGQCVTVCPYSAIQLVTVNEHQIISKVNPILCKGCGVCAVACPTRAIEMQNFTNDQLIAQISEALAVPKPREEPIIVGFCCNWCSYAGADMAGVSRYQYPPNIRIVQVMCSGRVDPIHILWAFLRGADGILVTGCHIGDCHYVSGNKHAEQRVKRLREMIERAGFDSNRLRLEWISASEGKRFSDLVTEFTSQIKALGPNPIKLVANQQSPIEGS